MRGYLCLIASLIILAGCKSDSSTPPPSNDKFAVSITGTFTTGKQLLSADKITVLFDNTSLASAQCNTTPGCTTLTVTGNAASVARGAHTVDLRLDQQSLNQVPDNNMEPYKVTGQVNVSNASGVVQQIPLDQVLAPFSPGESAHYQITINP